MSCILRISGESLDIDALVSQHSLPVDRVWKKGEARVLKGKLHSDSGANFLASDADLDEFDRQLAKATEFLRLHEPVIGRIVSFPGVQHAVLDFGISVLKPGYVAQYLHLPSEFIKFAASAGIAVELSLYACSEEGEES